MTDYINRFRPSQAEIERRYANIRAAMEKGRTGRAGGQRQRVHGV